MSVSDRLDTATASTTLAMPRMWTFTLLVALISVGGCGGREPLQPGLPSNGDPFDTRERDGAADGPGKRDARPLPDGPDARLGQAPTCELPSCIEALTATCPIGGSCVRQSTGATASNVCFDNGVKIFTDLRLGPGGMTILTFRVLRQDGGACFTLRSLPAGPVNRTDLPVEYVGSDGQQVATGTILPGGFIEITCPGAPPQVVDVRCQPGVAIPGGTSPLMCSPGMCQ